MEIKNVTVYGAGTMGHGIAEVCALAGYNVTLVDIKDEILQKAIEKVGWSLKKLEKKGQIKSSEEVLARIKTTTEVEEAAKTADYIIEAVVEKFDIKTDLFKRIDAVAKPECIIATNTSTLPISKLAAATNRPDKFIGLHFFNPPTLIRFVEIIRGDKTSDETVKVTKNFAKSIGMDYVEVKKDVPGFLVNRINLRVWIEGARLAEEGLDIEAIDACARYRLGMPMGLFEVMDFSGIDVIYYAGKAMKEMGFEFVESKLIEEKFKAGKLGMKTGEGFYKYPKPGAYFRPRIRKSKAYSVNPVKLMSPAINEAAWLIRNGVASKEDVEKAMKLGMNYSIGILEMADNFGIDRVVEALKARKEERGYDEYNPDPLLLEMVEKNELGKKTGKGFFTWKYEKEEFGRVLYEKRHDIAWIILNRPDKLNALDTNLWTGIYKAIDKAEKDTDVKAIILTGSGRAFSAGDDIAEMFSWKGMADARDFFEKIALPTVEKIMYSEKPIIAAVNGLAFGGGMELCLLCDIVVASEGARFAVPEALIGALPPIAASIGVAVFGKKMIEAVLTGEEIEAEEAKEIGIVNAVVSSDQLEDVAREYAEKMRNPAPRSVAAIKKIIGEIYNAYSQAFKVAMREILIATQFEDFKEGMGAFLKKKRPEWRGR